MKHGLVTLFVFLSLFAPHVAGTQLLDENSRGSSQASPNRAWVALLTGNSYNNTQLAATQILSVERYSRHKHVTLVLPTVNEETREFLRELPTEVVEVSPIYPPYEVEKRWWKDVFAKFNIFNMVEYDQVAYLDADAFLMKDADKVFDLCDVDICGVKDNRMIDENSFHPKEMVNAGLLVVRPSQARFEFIVHDALPRTSDEYTFPEQGFLTELYLDKVYQDDPGEFKWLSWEYNSCSRGYFEQCQSSLFGRLQKQMCPEAVHEQVVIHHHCGPVKLHDVPLCEWEDEGRSSRVRNDEPGQCAEQPVQRFQELLLDVNPCARGGLGEDYCLAMAGQCQWCSNDVRCVSSNTECTNSSGETMAGVQRRAMGTSLYFYGRLPNFVFVGKMMMVAYGLFAPTVVTGEEEDGSVAKTSVFSFLVNQAIEFFGLSATGNGVTDSTPPGKNYFQLLDASKLDVYKDNNYIMIDGMYDPAIISKSTMTNNLSIGAEFKNDAIKNKVDKVKFYWDGKHVQTENSHPYTIGSNSGTNYDKFDKLKEVGEHVVKAVAYDGRKELDTIQCTIVVTD